MRRSPLRLGPLPIVFLAFAVLLAAGVGRQPDEDRSTTYSQFLAQVESDGVERVKLDAGDNSIEVTPRSGEGYETAYPDNTEQNLLNMLGTAEIPFDVEGKSGIAREIDDEIRRIVEEAHQLAREILEQHREKLDMTSEILLKRETIEREQFIELLDGKSEEEVFGEDQPALPAPPPAPEAPERKPERAPKPLPRPGLAGGTAQIRAVDPARSGAVARFSEAGPAEGRHGIA
jgi:ATP-dependent Zn protease